MRNITRINEEHLQINALFIQPTNECVKKCPGCYVKKWGESNKGHNVLEILTWRRLFIQMSGLYNDKYYANQLTFAMDDLPFLFDGPDAFSARSYMKTLLTSYCDVASLSSDNNTGTEFHITTSCVTNIAYYDEFLDLTNISMLTISEIHPMSIKRLLELKKEYPDLHINWNLHVPYEKKNLDAFLNSFIKIAKVVDSIYMVIHKPDLGLNLNKSLTDQYFTMYTSMKKLLVKEKMNPAMLTLDGCVKDAKDYADDIKNGCSSNISRFQVWPDGSVSGCPYNTKPPTKSARTDSSSFAALDDVLDNIRAANKVYEFSKCKIPENLYPNTDRMFMKKNRSLLILED